MKQICKELKDEYESLDSIVSGLSESEWEKVTPFYGWTIKNEISHIAYFDEAAKISAVSEEKFTINMGKLLEGFTSFDDIHAKVHSVGGRLSAPDLLKWWRTQRNQLIAEYQKLDPKSRLPWYGPTMSARSSVTARLMETWAHGQDIVDALKVSRPGTDRLKHIAHIGVSTFGWTFKNRGMEIPGKKVQVVLTSPSGDIWSWNPEETNEIIKGAAEDFCLVVTQRRNLSDTKLDVTGDIAGQWMKIAQAFAGPPEDGPAAGKRLV
jgi:uncharacterized protein (TIGR03084 family)